MNFWGYKLPNIIAYSNCLGKRLLRHPNIDYDLDKSFIRVLSNANIGIIQLIGNCIIIMPDKRLYKQN